MEYIDLKEYFNKLLKNWLLIALCCVIGVTGAFIYSEFLATPIYASSIKMSVSNTDWSQNVSMNDIQTTVKLIENCLVVLEDDVMAEIVAEEVEKKTGESYSAAQVKGALSFTHIGESGFLRIEARTSDPELSALLCNVISVKAPELMVETVANIQMKTLGDGAPVNDNPVSPNKTKNLFLGFIVMFILSCGFVFLNYYFDKTVNDEVKLTEKYGLSILGVVPCVSSLNKVK